MLFIQILNSLSTENLHMSIIVHVENFIETRRRGNKRQALKVGRIFRLIIIEVVENCLQENLVDWHEFVKYDNQVLRKVDYKY